MSFGDCFDFDLLCLSFGVHQTKQALDTPRHPRTPAQEIFSELITPTTLRRLKEKRKIALKGFCAITITFHSSLALLDFLMQGELFWQLCRPVSTEKEQLCASMKVTQAAFAGWLNIWWFWAKILICAAAFRFDGAGELLLSLNSLDAHCNLSGSGEGSWGRTRGRAKRARLFQYIYIYIYTPSYICMCVYIYIYIVF